MKKTIASLLLLTMLFALCLKPASLPEAVRAVQQTRAHTEWRTDALASDHDVFVFDDGLFYSESDAENIVKLTDHFAYVNNEVIVYFADGVPVSQKKALFDSVGAEVVGVTDILNKYQLRLPKEKDFFSLQRLCAELRAEKDVQFASCNMAMLRTEDVVPDDPWLEPDGSLAAQRWDDDYVYGGNWWLTVTQTTSAWEHADLFHKIRIGIVDSGFDVNHEDLQGKFSFPNNYFERANHPSSHGTHVAGIISANANNKIGVTGICNNAELVCVDWEPEESKGQRWSTDERIFTGVIALIKSGAKVINMSLGASGNYEESKKWQWNVSMFLEGMLFSYTVAALLARGYDFLVVQSAGNGSKADEPCDSYYNGSFTCITKRNAFTGLTGISKQEVLNHVIVAGSSTYAHKGKDFYQSSFSNYGDGVSIFAPGSWVFSTDIEDNGKYSYKSGTSMAAPVVTGIAAMTWSVNPSLTGSQVKAILCDPANTVYRCVNYYWEDKIDIPSYPMINAKLSVEAAIKTLGLPEPETPTEPVSEESETETEPALVPATALVRGNSEDPIVEKFRGEIGE